MTSPEPVPAPAAPLAEVVNTEGSTSSATVVTLQVAAEPAAVTLPALEALVVVDVHPAPATATATTGISIQGHGGRLVPCPGLADGVTGSRPSLMTDLRRPSWMVVCSKHTGARGRTDPPSFRQVSPGGPRLPHPARVKQPAPTTFPGLR